MRCSRKASSCSSSVVVSGTNQGGVASAATSMAARSPSMLDQRLRQMLGVQHADDVLRLVAPQRHAGVLAVDHRVDDARAAAGRRPR